MLKKVPAEKLMQVAEALKRGENVGSDLADCIYELGIVLGKDPNGRLLGTKQSVIHKCVKENPDLSDQEIANLLTKQGTKTVASEVRFYTQKN